MARILDPLRSLWRKLRARAKAIGAPTRFLCDSCKFDHDRACHRRERPNATVCEDYERR